MNIIWNPDFRRFEVQFHDFTDEQPRVKAAGFKTDGPPSWVWYSFKSEPLTKLRENRPATLNITADARVEYTKLKEIEDRNAATKVLLNIEKKKLKKKLVQDKRDLMKPGEYFDEEQGFFCLKVGDTTPTLYKKYIPPPPPDITCFICKTPVYEYEYAQDKTPTCLWCQREVLDINEI